MEFSECMSSCAPEKRLNCGEILNVSQSASNLSRSSEVHYKVGDSVIVHYLDGYDDNDYK